VLLKSQKVPNLRQHHFWPRARRSRRDGVDGHLDEGAVGMGTAAIATVPRWSLRRLVQVEVFGREHSGLGSTL
jgi:hypothetical protein